MFRTMYKLTKVFADQAGPRSVTERLRNKIEKFRQHQPLLNVICNPGIRERHWQQVCLNVCSLCYTANLWLGLELEFGLVVFTRL